MEKKRKIGNDRRGKKKEKFKDDSVHFKKDRDISSIHINFLWSVLLVL